MKVQNYRVPPSVFFLILFFISCHQNAQPDMAKLDMKEVALVDQAASTEGLQVPPPPPPPQSPTSGLYRQQ